jgi:glutamine synthetase
MLASERGMVATFMPKPFAEKTGSGMHLHLSLTSGGAPVFPADEDARGLGLSETAYAFIGGILEHACALQAVVAPTVNSYKRTGATTTDSGASWAPRMPTYGGNDRTHYIRVPDAARIELRGADGSANPYLAIAAALGAGLDGIKRSTDPGGLGAQNRPPLPPTLLHALEDFQGDPVVTGVLDAAGQGVADYFAGLKRDEFFAYHGSVTPWEIEHYLTAF